VHNVFQIEYTFSLASPDGLLDRVETIEVAIVAATRQPRIRRA